MLHCQGTTEAGPTEDTEVSSWPVSYSVSSQGNSPMHVPQGTDDSDVTAIEALAEPQVGEKAMGKRVDKSQVSAQNENLLAERVVQMDSAQ